MNTLLELNSIARTNGLSLLAAVAAQRVLKHVENGGWLWYFLLLAITLSETLL